jgi:hypothetical protein
MENRAAVFTSSSQDVEVHLAGAWWSGSLLGWRHVPDGSCQVWVQAVVAGVERSTWTDLVDVRLPERPALHPVPTVPSAEQPVGRGRDEPGGTVLLHAVRGTGSGAVGDPAAGRPSGGRRRAPETQEVPAWATARRETAGAPAPSGRHRAPAPADPAAAGRHRAADTGVIAPVPAEGDVPAGAPATAPRPTPAGGSPRRPGGTRIGASTGRLPVVPEPAGPGDADFYTRPLRLTSSVPRPRSPRWDD